MTDTKTTPPIRRVAVALDGSPHSLAGLALAAEIAAALNAEVEGIFVEDTELLRSAGLPFLREVRITTLWEGALDSARLERELRAAARQMRAQLERSAAELGIAWSFRVWRGDLGAEILAAALDAELFTLARIGRFAPLRRPKRRRLTPGPVVGVLLDRPETAEHALTTAIALGRRNPGHLIVMLQSSDQAKLPVLRAQVQSRLEALGEPARLLTLGDDAPAGLGAIVLANGIDLLILDAGNPLLARPLLWESLEALGCPVVIGRA